MEKKGRVGRGSSGCAGAILWVGRGCDAQKLLYQPILRHLNFRVADLPLLVGTHPLIELLSERLNALASMKAMKAMKERTFS